MDGSLRIGSNETIVSNDHASFRDVILASHRLKIPYEKEQVCKTGDQWPHCLSNAAHSYIIQLRIVVHIQSLKTNFKTNKLV